MAENNKEKPIIKSKTAEREEEILRFWQEKEIFKKTLEKPSPKGEFVFYDGPPFATGLPHYGHILAGTMKDYVGRYQTMKGKHVARRWGWDTHGLPIENIVEQEIGLKSKKDIEDFGLEKFNDIARTKVFTYADEWKKIIPRMGRFVDMENDYRTMNPTYTETVWWVFKELHKKGLVYEGFKSMHLCPHCGTTLSNFEVTQEYKDITDISVTVKFELVEEPGTYFLAWTTTPWTLPGNVALAVNPEIDYVKIKIVHEKSADLVASDDKFILAESRLSIIKDQYEILEKIKGKVLVGMSYKPLFDYYQNADSNTGNKQNADEKRIDADNRDADERGLGMQMNADNINSKLLYEDLSYIVRGIAFDISNTLGFGHKESVYQNSLEVEFKKKGVKYEKEKNINVIYDGKVVDSYRPDFVIDDKIILEIKSLPFVGGVERKQILHYLNGSEYKLALLINFGTEKVQIERMVFDSIRDNQRNNPRKSAFWENGFKVYDASFVTTEDGTGIVHIAPAFGEDDLKLGNEKKLPFIQHVGMDGIFKKEVKDFAGQKVKPIENPQLADIEIIKFLAGKGTLFAKEKFIHSYPHCYRCHTPLLNYATSSWFVEVTKIKDKLVEANKKIKWVPYEVGDGRFGKWLEGARDWAISRTRFWGAPLPVWKCTCCPEKEFIGSIEEIKERTKSTNKLLIVRHGESESNVSGILSSNPKTINHLTGEGREQAVSAAKTLKDKVDIIYCSPFMRTKETAEIIAENINYPKDKIIYDERLHEIYGGEFDGKKDLEYQAFFGVREEKFTKRPKGGETYEDAKKRMTEFLYEVDKKNEGKNILIISHNTPIWLMFCGAQGLNRTQALKTRKQGEAFIENSEIREMVFAPIPHNRNYELDMHRPFIDEITLKCKCGGVMKRVPEVFDCWFESGSMPYAQFHYPFENLDKFNPEKGINFPADFIAEGLDQTRGWFYSMLVLSIALFEKTSYKNVVANGMVLAEDGKKMSKHLKNYPDPIDIVSTYSADALRYYLLSSPAMKSEDLRFSNKNVDEILKKNIMRLQNVYTFFEMYGGFDTIHNSQFTIHNSNNILDKWILIRLKETATQITKATDSYELDRATRPIGDFIDDLSTWFIRRSRDRFKSEDVEDRYSAMFTTKTVILEFSKLLAPSMPFLAEDLYLKITGGMEKESVHLENWTEEFIGELSDDESDIIEKMKETRLVVSVGLEARAKVGIKVRQPLASLKIKSLKLARMDDTSGHLGGLKDNTEYLGLIKEEVNVKEVVFDESIIDVVELDAVLTKELKEEGMMRDVVRVIQEMRKNKKLNPGDLIDLIVDTDEVGKKIFEKFSDEISKITGLKEISFEKMNGGELIELDGLKARLLIE